MKRSTDRSVNTPRTPAKQQPLEARQESLDPAADMSREHPEADMGHEIIHQAVNDADYALDTEDNGEAWAHQLQLEARQRTQEDAAANQHPGNYFTRLAGIDVSEHVEKKGQFSYLSWAWAVDRLRKAYPEATWEVKRFDGLPYLKTDCGYFVEVAVTVAGVTLSQIHPVLDARNRPISEPNAFEINTSIQRCLVKAIALHGLGLYVYAGEDLPEGAAPATINEAQRADLQVMIDEVGADKDRFLEYFKIEKLADLPAAQYQRAVTALEKKRQAA